METNSEDYHLIDEDIASVLGEFNSTARCNIGEINKIVDAIQDPFVRSVFVFFSVYTGYPFVFTENDGTPTFLRQDLWMPDKYVSVKIVGASGILFAPQNFRDNAGDYFVPYSMHDDDWVNPKSDHHRIYDDLTFLRGQPRR